jgi:hypothetical protein
LEHFLDAARAERRAGDRRDPLADSWKASCTTASISVFAVSERAGRRRIWSSGGCRRTRGWRLAGTNLFKGRGAGLARFGDHVLCSIFSRLATGRVSLAGITLEELGYLNGCGYVLHDRHTAFCAAFRGTWQQECAAPATSSAQPEPECARGTLGAADREEEPKPYCSTDSVDGSAGVGRKAWQ